MLKRNDTASQFSGGKAALAKLKLGKDSDGGGGAMAEEDEKESLLMARAASVNTPLAGFTPREGYCGTPEQMLATQLAKVAAEEEVGIAWYKDRQARSSQGLRIPCMSSHTCLCILGAEPSVSFICVGIASTRGSSGPLHQHAAQLRA